MNIIKENRALSFLMLALVYIAAAAIGIVCFIYLPLDTWLSLLIADVVATVFVYAFSLVFKNASVYDPYWSVQPMVIVAAFLAASRPSAAGILVSVAVFIWGARLTANWAYTFKDLTHEDWRYASFRESTRRPLFFVINLFGFHMMPTLIVYACTLPAVYIITFAPALNGWSIAFFITSLAAVALQGVADCTMHAFRRSGEGGFNRRGVWKYSRHPNYLAEIVMWWSVGLSLACVLPLWPYTALLAGALANTLMFVFISVPLSEKRQSRKDGFGYYKSCTRMFLPIKVFPPEQDGKTL